jgi:hypothetical protein
MRTRIAAWVPLLAIVATAILFVFPPVQHPSQPIKLFPDSATYLSWGYGRPPVPFLYFSLIGAGRPAVIVQTVLSICCWTALGWTALGTLGAIYGAALAGSLWVALWSFCVLSEGPTLSFGAALVASTLALGQRWSWPRFALWSVCALLFTGLRLENFFLVPILLGSLLLWHRAHWLSLGLVGVAMTAMFVVFGLLIDKQNHNWHIRMTNLVLTRILPDPQLAEYFHQRGLPHEPNLLAWKNQMLAAYQPSFVEQTPEFQRWLEEGSRAAYMRWLTGLDPHRRLLQWMDHILNRSEWGHDYYTAGVKLPGVAMDLTRVYDAVRLPFGSWVWLAAIPVACALLSWRIAFIDLFTLAYMIGVYVMAFIVYHADSGELERHMVFVSMLYRMAPVIALGCVWERIIAFAQRRWGTVAARAPRQVDAAVAGLPVAATAPRDVEVAPALR